MFRIKNRARKLSFSFTRILSIQAWKPIIFLAWNALGFALSKFVALLHFLDIIYHGRMTDWKISLQIASIIYKPQHSHSIAQTYQENRKGDPWNKYVFVNLSLRNVHGQWDEIVFCCIAAWIQPDISGCQQDFLVVWKWNQLRTF